jgi:hypothetical protein
MKKIITWGALLLSLAIASCSSSDSKPKGADAGAGGDSAGSSSIGGDGSETSNAGTQSDSGGGTSSSGEAGQGQGGEGGDGSSTFSVKGTVYAPQGGDVEGTVVIGCAWIDEGCDEQKSQVVQVSKSGASGPYALADLERGQTYLVLFWKDMNGTGEVDDDDYIGVVADESGAARAFTSAAASADGIMAIQQEVVTTDVPEELVGDWFVVATSIGVTNAWTFGADGSASNAFTMNSAFCGGGAGTATNTQGVISVDGNELTFSPTSGKKTVKPCSGDSTTTDYYTNVRHFTWRVGPSTTQAGTALYLTDQQNPDPVEAEFQKL